MKKTLPIFLFLVAITMNAQDMINDTITISKENLLGRWTEVKRSTLDNEEIKLSYTDCYIFKEDLSHKGQITEGIILFDITGRYKIDGDSISIKYFDLLGNNQAEKHKLHTLRLKVIALSDTEINAYVKEKDRNEYYIRLQKQNIIY